MLKLSIFPLVAFVIIFNNSSFCQAKFEMNDFGIEEVKLGDSVKHLKDVVPLNKSDLNNFFSVFPKEKYFFTLKRRFLNVGLENVILNGLIFSVSEDNRVNNIFIYLFDPNDILKKILSSKNYKKGWTLSTNSSDFLTWITLNQTCITLIKNQYIALGSNIELRFVRSIDSVAISEYYILPKN